MQENAGKLLIDSDKLEEGLQVSEGLAEMFHEGESVLATPRDRPESWPWPRCQVVC